MRLRMLQTSCTLLYVCKLACVQSFVLTCTIQLKLLVCFCVRSLEMEQSLRRKAELESAQYKLKLQVVTSKYGQTQQELQVSVITVSALLTWSCTVIFLA